MKPRYVLTSVCRIADFDSSDFAVGKQPRARWEMADYVAAEVIGQPSRAYGFELTNGRLIEAMEGMLLLGAFGTRAATLEATGDWRAIDDSGTMDALTGAGLFGRASSVSPTLAKLTELRYLGHVERGGAKVSMLDFVPRTPTVEFSIPTILVIGTSMSSGKTTTGRIVIHELKRAGLEVAAAKFTGAGRYRDVLSFQDAGADTIIDFVDAGLPSTVVPRERFEAAMQHMLARIAASGADVLVAEAGASPLEPYNGAVAVEMLEEAVAMMVLSASDPYAVLGVQQAFGTQPDLVTGPTANTDAGIELVRRLTGLDALNLLRTDTHAKLRKVLERCLPRGLL
jgi:hypothetical protein